MKRILLLGLVLAVSLLGLSSCNTGSGGGALAGTWTVDSTEVTGGSRVLGDGSFNITYVGEVTFLFIFELYTGTGTIGGQAYSVDLAYVPDLQQVSISLYEPPEDSETHYIELSDISFTGGSSMDGEYEGYGDYDTAGTKDIGDGTFTATKS